MTKHRDAWADSKAIDPQSLRELTAHSRSLTEQLGAGASSIAGLARAISGATTFREFYAAVDQCAEASRQIAYMAHDLKLLCDFQVPPATVYNDHFLNQFFLMSVMRRTWWVEGPVFCGMAIEPGARILEIGCGTGYFTEIFFSPFASEIVAVDIDARAIETARRFHQAKNVRYEVRDVRDGLPEGPFDLVIWTPSIYAFSIEDVDALMAKVRGTLRKNALLCGFTFVEAEKAGDGVLWHDPRSLGARLKNYFPNVRVIERRHVTIQPHRQVMFFYASDGPLPFDAEWAHGLRL